MANILVVDDEVEVTSLIQHTLKLEGHDVKAAHSAREARETLRATTPDLIILDIQMGEEDGITFCRDLRQRPDTHLLPILFLSARTQPEYIVEGLDAGGDDYIKKPYNSGELAARVRAQLRRAPDSPQDKLVVGDLVLDTNTFQVFTPQNDNIQLTMMEYRLLEHMMSHPGQVHSVDELLEEVWQYPPGTGDPGLVRAHIRNVRAKVEPDPSDPTYIQTIFGMGYRIQG